MLSIQQQLTQLMEDAFAVNGMERKYGAVLPSRHLNLARFQCNGALAAAKQYRQQPRQIAQKVINSLADETMIADISVAGSGFININIDDAYLATYVEQIGNDEMLGCSRVDQPDTVVIDFGGPNVAKPMHVGHLRSSVIGESLKRIFRFRGDNVIGDIHLGDWGTQMGMIITEIERQQPNLSYFDEEYKGSYPEKSPVTIDDLQELYPTASQRCKTNPADMEAARKATVELQQGHPGYRALWQHFVDVSIAELKEDFDKLSIDFDLWLGESDAHPRISALIDRLKREGHLEESEGALVVDVSLPDDKKAVPPVILVKSDGGVLYATTDLATIEQRVQELKANLILYVVDYRQSDHFLQVFRCAYKTGVAPRDVKMEHIAFGTVNGKDGKPFKTREGGVMRLKDLISMIIDSALERMEELKWTEFDDTDKAEIARRVGLAAIKFADLDNHYSSDYVFDLDKFSSFEGRTGPYLLYTLVRIKSILRKASNLGLMSGTVLPPQSTSERELLFKLSEFSDAIEQAYKSRAPNIICEFAYNLAVIFNAFYRDNHILRETDLNRQSAWLTLLRICDQILDTSLDLLGIETVEQM